MLRPHSYWPAILLIGGLQAATAPAEPKALSIYPFTATPGAAFETTVRGNGLRDATAVFSGEAPVAIDVASAGPEPSNARFDVVQLRVRVDAKARPGRYPLRLVTPRGVTNAFTLHVVDLPLAAEPAGAHDSPETAVAVDKVPVVFNGRIARRGESDYYAFNAKAGETLTFEAISGLPSIGAAGGNAVGFDPSLSLYEPSGSWFDPKRVNRIAFNDEPLWTLGQLTDAYLVRKFERAGRYLLRVEAFSGQGGPDYGYQLKILAGQSPQDVAPARADWQERSFSRRLSSGRLNELAERGGRQKDQKAIESYRDAPLAQTPAPLFQIPGVLEGGITQPGEARHARFHLDGPRDIAIEIETPAAAPPLFNPIVRLLDAAGREVATNILTGRGACNGEMNKSIQVKTILPLRDAGDYTVEVRDTTADLASPDFRYRILVRPRIAHIGQVRIDEDRINLAPGTAKTVRVSFDREEGYTGAVAVTAESLPPGVEALAGADFEPDKDPPRFPGKRERYIPREERVVVVFTAAPGAALTAAPRIARLAVRPIMDGRPGPIVATKQIPLMVIAKP